jgi:hypothetical protein
MPHFTVHHLREDQLAEAGGVLRLAGDPAALEAWQREARGVIARGGGVLVARAADGSAHALATYELAGDALAVARLVSFDLNRKQPARIALVDALGLIAASLGCGAVDLDAKTARRSAVSG